MAIILLIALAVIALAGSVATVVQIARDGYRPVPTRSDLVRQP